MNLYLPLPLWLSLATGLLSLVVLAWAAASAPWRKLMAVDVRQHLWYGGILVLGIGWSTLYVDVRGILHLHPLLITAATLIFGFRLALCQAALASTVVLFATGVELSTVGFSFAVATLAPAVSTALLWRVITRSGVQNVFLFTLGIGFAGGLLSALVSGGLTLLLLYLAQVPYFDTVWQHSPVFFLLMFPEGFLNGMIVSAMAIMAPQLVKTYDDEFYLK